MSVEQKTILDVTILVYNFELERAQEQVPDR